MREIAFLHFQPGRGFWYRHDPRLKLLELAAWSVLALAGGPACLGITAGILLILHGITKTRLYLMWRAFLFWAVMALTIVAAAGLAEGEPPLTIAGVATPFGLPGLLTGTLRSARLLTVLLAGQLLAATTDPADLAGGLRKLTSWGGLATALSLTLSFIPLLLDEAATIRDAAFSRGLGQRRSIFRRAFSLGLPMAEATLRRTDLTTEALLSRCYTQNPTPPDIRITGWDVMVSIGVILPSLAAGVLGG